MALAHQHVRGLSAFANSVMRASPTRFIFWSLNKMRTIIGTIAIAMLLSFSESASADKIDFEKEYQAAVAAVHDASFSSISEREYAALMQQQRPLAERGDAKAQFIVGRMYEFGKHVPRSCTEAIKWYRKAAIQGYAEVQEALSDVYDPTSFSPCGSTKEAMVWARKAAAQGYAPAQLNLGYAYSKPWNGMQREPAEAVKWFRKAAEQGNRYGQSALALSYEHGDGVPQDYAEAVKWYRKALESGSNGSWIPFSLATMHFEGGHGLQQDYSEAAKWYRKSLQKSGKFPQAWVSLGWMYLNGRGVPRDYRRAYMWSSLAGDDNTGALQNLDYAARHMTRAQLEDARNMAIRCQKSNYVSCD